MPHQTASEQLHSSFRLVTLDLNQTIHFNSSRPLREIQQQSTLNNIHTANNADSIHQPENDSLLLSPNLCLFCSLFLLSCQLIDIHIAQQWCAVSGGCFKGKLIMWSLLFMKRFHCIKGSFVTVNVIMSI